MTTSSSRSLTGQTTEHFTDIFTIASAIDSPYENGSKLPKAWPRRSRRCMRTVSFTEM